MSETTWRKEIEGAMLGSGDKCTTLICTLSKEELELPFDNGFGQTKGAPFTAWTDDYVYFPIEYDGSEWCGSVPRNPNGNATWHQGG